MITYEYVILAEPTLTEIQDIINDKGKLGFRLMLPPVKTGDYWIVTMEREITEKPKPASIEFNPPTLTLKENARRILDFNVRVADAIDTNL